MSSLPKFSIRELLEAGVHYGHKTMRWNPRMAPYLYGSRNGIHIIDLQQTAPLLHRAMNTAYQVARNNGRILFVGTKRQASGIIAEAAERSGQYYVNHRWLGGMLTNWNTVSQSIKTLRKLEATLSDEHNGLTKKEILGLERQREKLQLSLGGIMNMGGMPDLLFVVDTNKESLSMKEANRLGIPVVAVLDSNSNPEGVDLPIPGNDDATRSIELYCRLMSDAILAGVEESVNRAGGDVGAQANAPKERATQAKPKAAKKDVKKAETSEKEAVKTEKKPAAKKAEDAGKKEEKSSDKPAAGAKKSPAKAKEEKSEEKPEAKAKAKKSDESGDDKSKKTA